MLQRPCIRVKGKSRGEQDTILGDAISIFRICVASQAFPGMGFSGQVALWPRSSILAKRVKICQEVLAKVVIVPSRIILDIWRNRCNKAFERIADERVAVRVFECSG